VVTDRGKLRNGRLSVCMWQWSYVGLGSIGLKGAMVSELFFLAWYVSTKASSMQMDIQSFSLYVHASLLATMDIHTGVRCMSTCIYLLVRIIIYIYYIYIYTISIYIYDMHDLAY
jgi:hypothetical protein